MAERDLLLTSLVAELLGPRHGPTESLRPEEDPISEYITGVLAPYRTTSVEPDSEADLIGEELPDAEDQSDPGVTMAPPIGPQLAALPSPVQDPKSRPASLGLSFALDGQVRPLIDICSTWARYERSEGGAWRRRPIGETWPDVDCSKEPAYRPVDDPGVALRVRCRHDGRVWRVSVFLVNTTSTQGQHPLPEEHIFQPQIRVRCSAGVRLAPLVERKASRDEEESALALLYRQRPSFARGHLCAALWREIDPERPLGSTQSPSAGPFAWPDGEAVFGRPKSDGFSPADVRTEYVPVVAVNAPAMTWEGAERVPLLDPEALSESWDTDAIRAALEPLATGYAQWIARQEVLTRQLPSQEQVTARRHLDACQRVLARIREGIGLLVSDADARLAFAFANRVMAVQSRWTRQQRVLPWRPFQLAFQLMNLASVAQTRHPDREICDLLWFPTGGGKTEAYLGLAAFTMALRRLRGARRGDVLAGGGVAVLSRYTLRLLTIQQFRRALAMITACEFLRVDRSSGKLGWRPRACEEMVDSLWGDSRFSVGLWVGGGVTPNELQDFQYKDRAGRLVEVRGALSILEGAEDGDGEPAQVLYCPACGSTLAVPPEGYQRGEKATLHVVLGDASNSSSLPANGALSIEPFEVTRASCNIHHDLRFCTLTLEFSLHEDATPKDVDSWFRKHLSRVMGSGTWVVSARASRPGYFVRYAPWGRRSVEKRLEFEIFCPNPQCTLNEHMEWRESTPLAEWPLTEAFRGPSGASTRCPIPAWTVDEQIYHRCPSMVVGTVDKFARLSFDPRAASMFGGVDRFNEHLGYYRRGCPPKGPSSLPTRAVSDVRDGQNVDVARFPSPDLILQDELHLIEGPLGSMVGIYETAVDLLGSWSNDGVSVSAKYIASTATVRQASDQVASIFKRSLSVFPSPVLDIGDSFFARTADPHPLESQTPGRVYVGVCAPGRGAQTPIVRIWSRLLQHVAERRAGGGSLDELDPFWTLVGYFNAIRELAGAVALARQDLVLRLAEIGTPPRQLDESEPMELSSRADSLRLPGMLEQLQSVLGGARLPVNLVVATSMFGTGVDVERLGLMVVHGQPKTTSSYIQATGRVGRSQGGLVITFFRASRPRDLNHYEYFAGYHRSIYRHVEPITVNPFAPRARDRAIGPVAVAILRQASSIVTGAQELRVHPRWRVQQRLQGDWHCLAHEMSTARGDPDVLALPALFESRAQAQPAARRPAMNDTFTEAGSELDRWHSLAAQFGARLLYNEPTLVNPPSRPVVLGDLAHLLARTGVAYEDAPNSLREVESSVTIQGWS